MLLEQLRALEELKEILYKLNDLCLEDENFSIELGELGIFKNSVDVELIKLVEHLEP